MTGDGRIIEVRAARKRPFSQDEFLALMAWRARVSALSTAEDGGCVVNRAMHRRSKASS